MHVDMQHVYRATVVARLMYAASAWRGLAKVSDLRRINAVIDRARRHRYCPPNLPTFDEQLTTNCLAKSSERSPHTTPTTNYRVTELQPQASHTPTTTAKRHHTSNGLFIYHTNAVQNS